MYQVMYYIHVITAIGLLFYLLLPFLAGRAAHPGGASPLLTLNRIGQYVLILAFLTGGYMVGKAGFSVPWMILAVVLVLVMLAMAGMMQKQLKLLKNGGAASEPLRKLRTFSTVAAVSYVLLIVIMTNPDLL
jgi:uncharacterized membrane protein